MAYLIPEDIWDGLHMSIENGKIQIPEKKLDCLETKLRAAHMVEVQRGYSFRDVKVDTNFRNSEVSFYIGYSVPATRENSRMSIIGHYAGRGIQTLPLFRENSDWTAEKEREVFKYIRRNLNWFANHHFNGDDESQIFLFLQNIPNPNEDQFHQFVINNTDTWQDIIETVDIHATEQISRQLQRKVSETIRSCTDTSLQMPRMKATALNVSGEKGLPPLVLEPYLGVPRPASGSEAMKQYYKKHAALGVAAEKRESEKKEAKEEAESAEALAAMKAGRKKKTRRQKKHRGTRRR